MRSKSKIQIAGMLLMITIALSAVWWSQHDKQSPPAPSAAIAIPEPPDRGENVDQFSETLRIDEGSDHSNPPNSDLVDRLNVALTGIEWRPMVDHTDRSMYPPHYEFLKFLAENGDAEAAYFLWQGLQYCDLAGPPPMSDAELEAELRLISESHQLPQYKLGERTLTDLAELNTSVKGALELAQYRYDNCKNMPLEQRGNSEQWKDLAILNGSRAATSVVAWELSQEGDPSALFAIWRDGDAMALRSIAAFYGDQYGSGADPAGLTKQYAYWLAFRELHYASRAAAAPDMRSFFGSIEITTRQYRDQLLPGQITEARELAKEILRDRSEQCCFSLDVPR